MGFKPTPKAERFWKYVKKTPTCWLWTAVINQAGYGQICTNQRPDRAHRVSWEIHNGPIPDGLCVLHKCDNPPCVNPDHLFLGTRKENKMDEMAKGRHRWGATHPTAKLSEDDVRSIRGDIQRRVPINKIAANYKVCCQTISDIKHRRRWTHVI